MDEIAVVILNYNGKHYLEKFLPALIKNSKGARIYIGDNNSSDDSVSFLNDRYPDIKLIKLGKNYGFSGGYNRVLSQVNAHYFVLLNSDVEVTGNWLIPLYDLMEKIPDIGACQPKLLEYSRKDYFEYAGAAGGIIDKYGFPFCRGRIFRTMEKDFGQYNDTVPVFWASGACFMVRSTVFKDLGGFDEEFFAHMEEIDLCWRMKLAGWLVYYTGDSVVYHVGGGTLPESNPYKTYLNFRNSFITLIKNMGRNELIWRILSRFIFDILAAFRFFLNGSFKQGLYVFRADGYILANFYKIWKKRRNINRKFRKPGNIYQGSIVLSYYFLRKKYFFNLRSVIPDPIISSSQPFAEIHGKS